MANPGKPQEMKQIIGSRNLLPSVETVLSKQIPEPPRRLDESGLRLWNEVWQLNWLNPMSDIEAVVILCERLDERDLLRSYVLDNVEAWRERASLRKLEEQIESSLKMLVLNPTDRTRLGLVTVKTKSKLQELLDAKKADGK